MKVKRILSSIMAAVMVATSLVAVNVSNVWAADLSAYVDLKPTGTDTKLYTFKGSTTDTVAVGDTFGKDITVTSLTAKGKIAVSSGEINMTSGSQIGIKVPGGSTGTVEIVAGNTKQDRTCTLEGGNTIAMVKTTGASAKFTDSNSDGVLTITSTSDYKFLTLKIVLDEGFSYGEETSYNLTGACSGLSAGETFDLGSLTVTVNDTGKGYSKTTDTVDENKEYVASKQGYTVSYGDGSGYVKFSPVSEGSDEYQASTEIIFTEKELMPLTNRTYVGANDDYFKYSQTYTGAEKEKINGSITFKLDSTKKVTVNGTNGSSDKECKVTFTGTDGKTYSSSAFAANATINFAQDLPAGVYVLTADKGYYLTNITVADPDEAEDPAFTILKISPTDVQQEFVIIGQLAAGRNIEDYEEVGIKVGKTPDCNNQLITPNTLYKGIRLSDTKVFNENDSSLFAVLVKGVTKADSKDNRIYARGYSRKVGSTVGTYSTYASAEIEKSTGTSTTEPTA